MSDWLLKSTEAWGQWEHDRPQYVAVDTETTGVTFWDTPFCVTVAWKSEGMYVSHYLELVQFDDPVEQDTVKARTRHILNNSPSLVFHNAKFDLQKLSAAGLIGADLRVEHSHDTEALAHLLDEHRRSKKLKALARETLGEETDEETVVREAVNKVKKERGFRYMSQVSYDMLPRAVILPYALKDAEFTIRLFDVLYPQVKEHPELNELYDRERKLTLTLLRMEARGMGVDVAYVEKMAKEYNSKALSQEIAIRDMTGNEDFNPNSPKQILEAFEKRGVPLKKTDKVSLTAIRDREPLAASIMELRTLRKMHSTYLVPMSEEQRNGIIHPSFRQHGAKTGRMSSGGQEAD